MIARAVLALSHVVAFVLVAGVDPDARGPLGSIADLYLAGNEDLARERLGGWAAHLAEHELSPGDVPLPSAHELRSPAPERSLPSDPRLDAYLMHHLRDDAARALFRSLLARRAGRTADAILLAEELVRRRPTERAHLVLRSARRLESTGSSGR